MSSKRRPSGYELTVVYARNENLEIYDILVGEFGDQAADAIVSG